MPSDSLQTRIFAWDQGHQCLLFFGSEPGELPDDKASAEISVVTSAVAVGPTRGATQDLVQELALGVLSNAAWTGLLGSLTATAAYLARRRRQAPPMRQPFEVIERLEAAGRAAVGAEAVDPAYVDIALQADGTWRAEVTWHDARWIARCDAAGTAMHLTRSPKPGGSDDNGLSPVPS
ncbi:hypothetical protein COUCH_00605 [Couchioplanes caeruleus]|uniref:hypothetical protein n=1 Tax=Couchioplanes caeruleus TaxID=56438 RepID=UPI0020C12BCD|nr:hypothetical protein [Couchioplanes caeruleus]UQU64901.1 hypothetical protein COUCH_00605 [Couchioplanes caeruleus]